MRFSLLLLLVPALACAGGIVWTDRSSGAKAIRAVNFDGTNPHALFALAETNDPRGVVAVPALGKIFFCDRGTGTSTSGTIQAANLDGTGAPSTVVSTLNRPSDLRYLPSPSPGLLYFAEENGNALRRVSANGTGLQTLFSSSAPYFLDVDPVGGKLYWGTNGASIFSGPLAGGVADPALYSAGANLRGVCVDHSAGMIYWCEKDNFVVRRRALAGGIVQDLYTGLNAPHGLVLDLPAGKLYWVDAGTNSPPTSFNAKGVSRGDLDGSGAAEAIVGPPNSNQPWDLDLDTRTPGYAEWRARFFRLNATAANTALDADPDGDAAKNILEYALGFGPLNNSSIPAAEGIRVTDGGQEYPAIRFRRRVGATDVSYRPQVSTNLTAWNDNTTIPGTTLEVGVPMAVEDGMELATVRSTVPISTSRQFLRVWVQTP